jgi:hypothetical protein
VVSRYPYDHGEARYAREHRACLCEPCEDARERGRMVKLSLPASALVPFIPKPTNGTTSRGMNSIGGVRGTLQSRQERAIWRALEVGFISPRQADEVAVAMHMHPMEIWGDEWLA